MQNIKIDYKIECLAYLKLLESGVKVTQKEFCQKRSKEIQKEISFQYFRKTLCRLRNRGNTGAKGAQPARPNSPPPTSVAQIPPVVPDWAAIKEAFLSWKFATLSDVARHVGMHPNLKSFRQLTAGWHKERGKLKAPVLAKTLDILVQERAVDQVRDLYAQILAAHYRLIDFLTDIAENCQIKLGEQRWKTPWHVQMSAQAAIDLARAMERIVPVIRGLENLQAVHEIFDRLSSNEIGVDVAAIDLARLGVALPRPIEILLTKHTPEELPAVEDEITEEMIMAKRAEMLSEINTERVTFVRERKQLVARLKEETTGSDSFAAQALEEQTKKDSQK